ncbi:MAG: DUF3618 domain-containing protein [Frankiaceae bacterium]|nr:DUF3618 domain-containing protein [Frankiaceae bacterium]
MANDSSKGPGDEAVEGSWSPRRGAASPRTDAGKGGSPDPEQLAQDIERTREDLAETLDAIADKVSPKRVVDRTKTQAKADAQQAVATVKEASAHAAEVVKVKAAAAAESVKSGVAQAKERVSGDDAVRSPLAPATSVEVGAAAPVSATGALADATVVQTEPARADPPAWAPDPAPPPPTHASVF